MDDSTLNSMGNYVGGEHVGGLFLVPNRHQVVPDKMLFILGDSLLN